ncbi:MAG: tRNA (adenosine(37)-N6)-dimethylallyltransferase MiaA [Prevotella sp.]|nr:tRNA (adenosine(37)-N6)-dimethylallyltransferase MiaA [Prevotella sp.]
MQKKMVTILGPTASGKTRIAAALADRIGGEIISADSRQVYRRMDIGTGKDLSDYTITRNRESIDNKRETIEHKQDALGNNREPITAHAEARTIPYHLIDICEPGTKYNLFQYQQDFLDAYNDIVSRGAEPILCGGTGLYIESVLKGYALSPVPQNAELRRQLAGKSLEELTQMLVELKRQTGSAMHNHTDVDTTQRAIRAIEIETHNLNNPLPEREFPEIPYLIIGVDIDREERRRKITRRLEQRLREGMIDEVKSLLDSGIPADDLIYYGLEYKYVTEHIIGRLSFNEMFRQLEIAIHQFAKRQMTWFRGMERRGFEIHWIDAMQPMDEKIRKILELRDKSYVSGEQ